jgi:adenine-specific DNA-methyltransferase
VWTGRRLNANLFGTQLLTKIVNAKFPFPKSLYAVEECLKAVVHKPDATILDFFAGSGTTGHAVLLMNKNDGGNRKFILCTNNENNIAEEVTYPRISKVMSGYKGKGKEEAILFERTITLDDLKNTAALFHRIADIKRKHKGRFNSFRLRVEEGALTLAGEQKHSGKISGFGGNLKYYKTSFVRYSRNRDQLKADITRRCTEMLCLREGIFRLRKKSAEWKIFQQGNRFMAVYYDFEHDALAQLRDEMNKLTGDKVLYCFTIDPGGLDGANFSEWRSIRLEPIPQKILDVYKRILKSHQ